MKYALSLFCSLFLTINAFSQVTLGLKIQSGEAWHDFGDQSTVNGFDHRIKHYGASLEIFRAVTPAFAIGVAPGYIRRGTTYFPESDNSFGGFGGFGGSGGILFPFDPIAQEIGLRMNYIQLPFLVKWQTNSRNRLSFFVQAGAGFAYLHSGFEDITLLRIETKVNPRKLNLDLVDDHFNRFDFGAQAGLGLAFRVGKGKIQLSGEYYDAFLDTSQSFTSLNRNWSAGLGYAIQLGK